MPFLYESYKVVEQSKDNYIFRNMYLALEFKIGWFSLINPTKIHKKMNKMYKISKRAHNRNIK